MKILALALILFVVACANYVPMQTCNPGGPCYAPPEEKDPVIQLLDSMEMFSVSKWVD